MREITKNQVIAHMNKELSNVSGILDWGVIDVDFHNMTVKTYEIHTTTPITEDEQVEINVREINDNGKNWLGAIVKSEIGIHP